MLRRYASRFLRGRAVGRAVALQLYSYVFYPRLDLKLIGFEKCSRRLGTRGIVDGAHDGDGLNLPRTRVSPRGSCQPTTVRRTDIQGPSWLGTRVSTDRQLARDTCGPGLAGTLCARPDRLQLASIGPPAMSGRSRRTRKPTARVDSDISNSKWTDKELNEFFSGKEERVFL